MSALMAPGPGRADRVPSCQCFSERFFGANWREEYAILYDDSSLLWYKSKERSEPEGALVLRCAPELMAVGVFTRAVPRQPEFPAGTDIRRVIALGSSGTQRVQWFICPSQDDANAWMTAISNTLPPPPSLLPTDTCCARAFSLPGQVANGVNTDYIAGCPTSGPPNKHGDTPVTRRSLGDLCTGLMLAGAVTNWGQGLGWGCAQGWGGPASAFEPTYCYADVGAGAADADFDCDADFGDFGGDFGGF